MPDARQDLSDEVLTRSLFVKWLVSVCTSSCLVATAYSLFGFDKQTELQCELHALYMYTLRSVDVNVQDCIQDLVDDDRIEEASALGVFKDEELNPILNKEYAAARWIEDQIALGGFDIKAVSARIKELEGKRTALSESISAAKENPESKVKLEWPEGSWLAKWAK